MKIHKDHINGLQIESGGMHDDCAACVEYFPGLRSAYGSDIPSQVLGAEEKRLHIFIRIEKAGEPVATAEQMPLHVDMKAGKPCPAAPEVLAKLMPIAEAHSALPRPEAAARHVGQRRS